MTSQPRAGRNTQWHSTWRVGLNIQPSIFVEIFVSVGPTITGSFGLGICYIANFVILVKQCNLKSP